MSIDETFFWSIQYYNYVWIKSLQVIRKMSYEGLLCHIIIDLLEIPILIWEVFPLDSTTYYRRQISFFFSEDD